ncbi:MAG: T9SS type A sorting domain-containing protein [Bacteroidetes bacterium]|jgi:hypothetical protein|nr:T9SS type A sorting domain-containing protein [Bacteroidota bacterium]MBT6687708.1 T9SS type A sorting domain-containing protein [Bacteroidota bacterium]MBT7143698.1 T9SS type A sorting domain-containing protein [Bacteroidota bacterium]MBT7493304.1 T9SS type A sorting domain-containing protein [Bacteroidota bacterium]
MRKLIIISVFIHLIASVGFSQEIISTSGDYFENPEISLSWTIGEVAVETFSGYNFFLSQGFQQPLDYQLSHFQNITLNEGWSMISTFIDKESESISTVFQPVVSDVIIIKDETGNIYWPQYGIDAIGYMGIGKGYSVNMINSTALTISGLAVFPEETPIPLDEQWNMIGYLRQSEEDILDALSDISQNITIFKNDLGQVYWPYYNYCSISNLVPGEGYTVKMETVDTLVYSPNGQSNKSQLLEIKTKFFKDIQITDNNMTLGILASAFHNKNAEETATSLKIDDEIGVFNQEGKLVGASVYKGGYTAITIWGDDELTSHTDGMKDKEKYFVKILKNPSDYENIEDLNTANIQIIEVENWLEGNEFYKTNKIAIVSSFKNFENNVNANEIYLHNYPNPFDDFVYFEIEMQTDEHVQLSIFNILGEKIDLVLNQNLKSGYHKLQFDMSQYLPGTYYYKLRTKNFTASKQIVKI